LKIKTSIILFVIFFWNISCTKETSSTETKRFVALPSEKTNIAFENKIESTPELNILNYIYFYNGSGVATADFNNDNLQDIYFGANLHEDALYLNNGDFSFNDISEASGIKKFNQWSNGITTTDINNDGWTDIYVCNVAHHENRYSHNLLFVNQGINEEGIPTFKESAKAYNLDYSGYSTQAAFFDYDLDGDLDLFLLNHATNPNQNYGNGERRKQNNPELGDKLFENIDGTFVDVSNEANIYQSSFGYGLGLAISDVNNDGYPDIYVGNDFFENDYLYINQGNKTFKEVIYSKSKALGHSTHFSMGNCIADINNDGFTDILSVDMLPEDLKTYKTSGTEFNYQIYQNYLKNGYAPQYMQNNLQINNGFGTFSETAFISGVAATEWSWAPLIADFDNDGLQDIYITNGILGATNDMDFINFIANENIQKSLGNNMTEKELRFIKKIPEKKTSNYLFKNQSNLKFVDSTKSWFPESNSFSNGGAYVDLENDGDLDLIVNNVNQNAFILKNMLDKKSSTNYLKIKLNGTKNNLKAIGTKVLLYHDGNMQLRENFPVNGFLSSIAPQLHFGLKNISLIDSLFVVWPDKTYQKIINVKANQTLELDQSNGKDNFYRLNEPSKKIPFVEIETPITFKHQENINLDFNKDPLLPYSQANEGPEVSISDVNNDGLEDLFIGGAKGQTSKLYIQNNKGKFISVQEDLLHQESIKEAISHVFFDANSDGFQDLIVGYGGNEFKTGNNLRPTLYLNNQGRLQKDTTAFNNFSIQVSKIKVVDINQDGYLDISFISNAKPTEFGYPSNQYLFFNDGNGTFSENTLKWSSEFKNYKNANDIHWKDFDKNGYPDALLVGHFTTPTLFLNNGQNLTLITEEINNGFWNTLEVADFDQDGDIDFIAGNWGLNSRLKASEKEPITLYKFDFDQNGSEESILTYYYQGKETTLASKEELAKQMPAINKEYLSFEDFANATINQVFDENKLAKAMQRQVTELASCYFENQGDNTFTKKQLPFEAQVSTVNDILLDDINNDGFIDAILIGNNYEISTQLGRLDAQLGTILLNDTKGFFTVMEESLNTKGACRKIEKIKIDEKETYIITRNNDTPIFIQKNDE